MNNNDEIPENEQVPQSEKSNVVFVPAQTTENTKVLVINPHDASQKNMEILNVVKAKLEYNPELSFPVLYLEIVNPTIIYNS
jgi:hypothetical protein